MDQDHALCKDDPMTVLDVKFAGQDFRFFESTGVDHSARSMQAGNFEEPLPIMVMAMASRVEGILLDVGANSGIYTVLAAKMGRDVVAFEPFPPCIDIFEKNIELNGIGARVSLRRIALSDRTGSATLYVPDASHGFLETSASLQADFKPNIAQKLDVPVAPLDESGVSQRIGVIKVDIEGHEPAFLRGAAKTVDRDRPVIFCEVMRGADVSSLNAFVTARDYLPFRLRPGLAIFSETIGFDICAWNWAFVPRERIALFEDACGAHDLEIVRRAANYRATPKTFSQRLMAALSA